MSTSTPFAVSFPNMPDAGARLFDTFAEAAAFAARSGFHAIVMDGAAVVVARNGSMGGAVVAVDLCERCGADLSRGGAELFDRHTTCHPSKGGR